MVILYLKFVLKVILFCFLKMMKLLNQIKKIMGIKLQVGLKVYFILIMLLLLQVTAGLSSNISIPSIHNNFLFIVNFIIFSTFSYFSKLIFYFVWFLLHLKVIIILVKFLEIIFLCSPRIFIMKVRLFHIYNILSHN